MWWNSLKLISCWNKERERPSLESDQILVGSHHRSHGTWVECLLTPTICYARKALGIWVFFWQLTMQQGVISGASTHQHNLSTYHIQAKVVIAFYVTQLIEECFQSNWWWEQMMRHTNWKLYPFMWNTFIRVFQVLNDRFQKAWQFFPMLVSSNWQKIIIWTCIDDCCFDLSRVYGFK
jgi:hypothetical protein